MGALDYIELILIVVGIITTICLLYIAGLFAYDWILLTIRQINKKKHSKDIGNQILQLSYWFSNDERIMRFLQKIGSDIYNDRLDYEEIRKYLNSLDKANDKKD